MYQNRNITDEEAQLRKLAPTLFEKRPRPSYVVPEDYFANFPARIQNLVSGKQEPMLRWYRKLWFRLLVPATVAACAIVIGISYFGNHQMRSANLSASDIHYVISDDPSELYDEEFVINNLSDEEAILTALGTGPSGNQDNQAIIEYLMDDNLDVSNIINEL